MSERWHQCPVATKRHPLLARILPWGIEITVGEKNGERRLNAPTWDLDIAELEWLLALAKGQVDV